jgi:hypothetical protein
MRVRTINSVIEKKLNDWLSSIKDESLQKVIRDNVVITGGCFTSLIMSEEPNDFDCYFKTKEAALQVANYYVKLWNEKNKDATNRLDRECKCFVLDGANPSEELLDYYKIYKLEQSASRMIANTPPERIKIIFPSDGVVGDPAEVNASEELGSPVTNMDTVDEVNAEDVETKVKDKYFPVFLSTNAITLSNKIQIVVRFYGNPEEIHDTYDFQHTKAYWTKATKTVIPNEVYDAVINKTLIYTGSRYPVCSIFRLRKFIKRGWNINAGQLLKICMQISQLTLNDIDVLEDQLIGVDSLYFMSLINQFKRQQETNKDFQLSAEYVMTVVDKVFG